MNENRRTKMSKKLIHDALIELLDEQSFEKISVTDICKRADVNRSTFYAYYNDTAELLKEIEDDTLDRIPVADELPVIYSDNNKFIDMLEKFFTYVKDNEKLFRVLMIRSDGNDFNNRLVVTIMNKYPKFANNVTESVFDYTYIYLIHGIIGILKFWIMQKFPLSPRDFSKLVLELSLHTVDIENIDL